MGLSDGGNSFQIGLAVLIQYRSVTASHPASQPASDVAVAITLNAKASSLKMSAFVMIRMVHTTGQRMRQYALFNTVLNVYIDNFKKKLLSLCQMC